MKKHINKLCMGLVLASACGGESSIEGADFLTLNAIEDNGIALNGLTLNGLTLNGLTLNGLTLNGLTLNGLTLNGLTLNGLTLNNGALSGVRPDTGATMSGKDFAGAQASFQIKGGSSGLSAGSSTTAVLRIDDAIYNETFGMYVYNVSIRTDSGWAPICGTANGVPVPAVPAPGSWDMVTGEHNNSSNTVTVACINAAIGKCITWGYRPWANKTECYGNSCRSQNLGNWLEACTRLVRADYCGDGVAHTRNGTAINVWDNLSIQLKASTRWDLEGEWATDGGHCIQHTRWIRSDLTSPYVTDYNYIQKNCPSRLASSGKESCGSSSDYNTRKGLSTSTEKRKLLRNESAINQ